MWRNSFSLGCSSLKCCSVCGLWDQEFISNPHSTVLTALSSQLVSLKSFGPISIPNQGLSDFPSYELCDYCGSSKWLCKCSSVTITARRLKNTQWQVDGWKFITFCARLPSKLRDMIVHWSGFFANLSHIVLCSSSISKTANYIDLWTSIKYIVWIANYFLLSKHSCLQMHYC